VPSKKLLQYLSRAPGQNSASDIHLVIHAGVIHHLQNGMDRSGLRVAGAIYQPAQSRVNYRSCAHCARLNCYKQFTADEPVITNRSPGFAHCHNFGMGGRVVVGEVAIPPAAYDPPFAHNYRSDRHFSGLKRPLGAVESFRHPNFIENRIFGGRLVSGRQVVSDRGCQNSSCQASRPVLEDLF